MKVSDAVRGGWPPEGWEPSAVGDAGLMLVLGATRHDHGGGERIALAARGAEGVDHRVEVLAAEGTATGDLLAALQDAIGESVADAGDREVRGLLEDAP